MFPQSCYFFLRPFGAGLFVAWFPAACAMGCILALLRSSRTAHNMAARESVSVSNDQYPCEFLKIAPGNPTPRTNFANIPLHSGRDGGIKEKPSRAGKTFCMVRKAKWQAGQEV